MADEGRDSESKSGSDVEEYSGMEQPPLIKQLKTILAEYPDDGQIIMELVQNAEDAGATEMKILFDGRRLNTDTTEELPYRKFCKAPALCFYNNEVFSDDDWEGIGKIYSSVKAKDPLKVGRFGLGFKSVFHITDNPCIISGNKVLLMNPHHKDRDRVCIVIKLKRLRECKSLKVEEFLQGCETFGFSEDCLNTGEFKGTIFWFPLRETASELSDTCYDGSKVLDLFKSFQSEAVHSLLFLKSLCKVELYCRYSDSDYDLAPGEAFFSVELEDGDGKSFGSSNLYEERTQFINKVKASCEQIPKEDEQIPKEDIVCVTHPSFKTRFKTPHLPDIEDQSSWVVINVFKGGTMSDKLRQLVSDKELSYMPYVGAAVPRMTDNEDPLKGHIFCFLPLPQEKKSLTGLPVHFNGFFALSANRRHLKWASDDQEKLNMHRDKSIEWNNCLVNEVLPGVYMRLINEMVKISKEIGNTKECVDAVYRCIPDEMIVDGKWEGSMNALFEQLIMTEFVFASSQSKWMKPNQPLYTMFDDQNVSRDQKEAVMKVLRAHLTLESTQVPKHIWKLIKKKTSPTDISPNKLCEIIRQEDKYKHVLDPEEKLNLLEYITKDGKQNGGHGLLQGLELLPLQNGQFVKFHDPGDGTPPLYYCTAEQMELFPGLEDKMVSKRVPACLNDILQHMAYSGKCQLRTVAVSGMVRLLEETIKHRFGNSEPVMLNLSEDSRHGDWIEKVWKYLFEHFSESLSKFAPLPLLPKLITGRWEDDMCKNGEIHLFCMNKMFLLKSDIDVEELTDDVCKAFQHFSVVVLPSLPSWLDSRQLVNVFSPTGPGLVRLMEHIYAEKPQSIDDFNGRCQPSESDAFVILLEKIISSLKGKTVMTFLQKLRLFTLKTSPSDVHPRLSAITEHSQMIDATLSLPIRFPKPLLVSNSQSCMAVARKLGGIRIMEDQLIIDTLRAINNSVYTTDECDEFMAWLLARLTKYQGNKDIISLAQKIAFVSNGILKHKPSDLFDPRDKLLASLFAGENKFPAEELCSKQNLNALKMLGLRTVDNVTPNCLYTMAKKLDQMCSSGYGRADVEQKAKSLLKIFEKRTDILSSQLEATHQQLHVSVRDLKCFPHQRERPADYPEDLKWKGSDFVLCSIGELRSFKSFASIAGSVVPLIRIDSQKLAQLFNLNYMPEANVITKQLENLIKVYSETNKPYLSPFILNVYKTMKNRPEIINCTEFQKLLEDDCIWWGNGFCSPGQIVLEKKRNDIDLKPYMYLLPGELESFKTFFEKVQCNKRQDISVLLKVLALVAEKHRLRQQRDKNEYQKDLQLVLQILNKLFQDKANPEQCGDRLLFPVHTGDDAKLVLKPYIQCTYCDTQWLKELTEDDDDDIVYVHADVPSRIAEGLGVKSLKRQLMSDAEGLEEWGQKEPLTRRIHNILKDGYVDGLAVPKEIIQNADDACATTVQFIYDERENLDARTQLLDEGMSECQGPALWAYNNAEFSESDLKNITKLSGATKETDTTKIGKFGLGFCAVYNLTDVPSFVSGQNMVIFDPHAKYLNKALPGNSPGLRINLGTLKNQRMMKRMNNQFKPFQGVFDCNLLKSDPSFRGTLFRLPLRTITQAGSSKIKNVSYTKEEMVTLLKQLVEAAGNLLLFTQNLREMKVLHIPPTGVHPTEAILMCKVYKEIKKQNLDSSVLGVCSKLKVSRALCSNPFSALQIINVTVEYQNQAGILRDVPSGNTHSQWLVSWSTGTSKSLELSYSTNIKGALPLGSVAVYINADEDKFVPERLSECPFGFYTTGHVFCYLPLPVQSNLDFHVNASFAVTSDRRSLQTSTEDDKYCSYDSKWNDALLFDAVAQAFVNALVNLQNPNKFGFASLVPEYLFHQFWPTKASYLSSFTTGFYTAIMASSSLVFQTYGQRQWLGFEDCIFLDKTLTQNSDLKDIALSTLQKFGCAKPSKKCVVDIPGTYLEELQRVDGWNKKMKIVGEEEFFLQVVLPNIDDSYWEDNRKARGRLMFHCLRHSTTSIKEKIKSTACIPTCPNGSLRKPQDLVHPGSQVSCLFSESDGRFPDKEFDTPLLLPTLVQLGMMKETLQAELIKERALSIVLLSSFGKTGALERCRHFIEYLSKVLHSQEHTLRGLNDIEFLPVLEKPDTWPFEWKAQMIGEVDKCGKSKDFDSPKRLFLGSCKKLVGCEEHLLDDNNVGFSASRSYLFEVLGCRSLSHIKPDTVMRQLLQVCNQTNTSVNDKTKRTTDEVLDDIYQFLNRKLAEHPDEFKTELIQLRDQPVIRIGSEFLPPSKVAFSLKYDCSPELYGLQNDRIRQYKVFLAALGVKDNFEVKDLIVILQKKKNIFQDTTLPQNEFQITFRLLLCLSDLMLKSGSTYEDISGKYGKDNILAPDTSQILRPTHMLCFDDCDDIEATSSMKFVHQDISPAAAERLGVLTKRTKQIEDCSIEIPFEQKEELVTRLKRLLDGYPCDTAVLKELLQNADDAGATEIHFVQDFKTHACNQIFDSGFKEFQGPALLVYNDSSFTRADLKGIQQLGIGSKSDDPAKTGQYGVGFNAVYNLTDLPSFLTKGPEIEGGETLCIFDPLHKHNKNRVGTRYVDMKAIRKTYPDVFSGYNESILFTDDQQRGTVFRFPLRQSTSEISSAVITQDKLEEIFASFKLHLAEMMFFLKSVTKVTVSTISDGKLKTERSVSVSFSDQDRHQRDMFGKEVKRFAFETKNKWSYIVSMEPIQVGYTMHMIDSLNREDAWYIVQRIGLDGSERVPEAVEIAAKDKKLGMLPVGGVAVRLPKENWSTPNIRRSIEMRHTLSERQRESGKGIPYCFLPLPGVTGLPMHINGHFILGHEARRGLWRKGHSEDFKSAWNHLLMDRVISLAYIEALAHMKNHIFANDRANYHAFEAIERVMKFFSLFPVAKAVSDDNWKYFVQCLLQRIVNNEEKFFSVIEKYGGDTWDSPCMLTWQSFQQTGHRFPLYVSKQNSIFQSVENSFDNLLRHLGMKIATLSKELQSSFADSGMPIPMPDASALMLFLKSYACTDPDKVKVDNLPCDLQQSLFRDISNVNTVLKVCSYDDKFGKEIDGLPLLVTSDEKLRCFSDRATVYCTKHENLLPSSAHKFVNKKQISTIKLLDRVKTKTVILNYHIDDFANMLQFDLDASLYARHIHVKWDPKTFTFPNKQWIKQVWDFFDEDFKISKKSDDVNTFEDFLKPVEHWALIPTLRDNTHLLVQISGSYSVLAIETFKANPNVQEALKKCHCPFLDTEKLSDTVVNLITSYLARAENPISVLQYLKYYKEEIREWNLESSDCCRILEYFSSRLETMKKEQDVEESWIRESLKSLPLYITKEGQARSFERQDCKVLVIPSGIPEDGLQQLAYSTGTCLLRNDKRLRELHKYLGFTYTDNIDVYLNHVLGHWDKLPDSAIFPHLAFIRDELLQLPLEGEYKKKQKQMIEKLRATQLISDNGVRKKASDYYSPHHPVFGAMCNSETFPPEVLKTEKWRKFLELVGMVHDVSASLFIKYAQEVATEGCCGITDAAKKKSEVLVDFMFKRLEEWKSNIYKQISHIRFVVPYTVEVEYTNVHRQNCDPSYFICFANSISKKFYELVWSSLPLLPKFEETFGYYNHIEKRELLGIHKEPPVKSVVLHTQNVCDSLHKTFSTNRCTVRTTFMWIELFMEKLYEFLSKKGIDIEETRHMLYNTPVVFIPEEFILVPAHRVIQDISSDQEISPYLLKAPVRYGKFFDMFNFLGAERYPSFLHYIEVLKMVKNKVKENQLTDAYLGEWGVIKKALEYLFYYLPQKSSSVERQTPEGTVLYLPTKDKYIKDSSAITVADNQYFEERIGTHGNLHFMIDLQALKLSYDLESFRWWLPCSLRPKFLSDMVKEEVDLSEIIEIETCQSGLNLERFIHSESFTGAMLRLLKHFKKKVQLEFTKKDEETSALRIQNTRVIQVTGLKTYLTLNGVKVQDSVEPKECFVPEPKKADQDPSMRIYLQTTCSPELELIHSIDDLLITYTHYVMSFSIPENIIMKVFRKVTDPESISIMLDKLSIVPYHMSGSISSSIFPDPGTYVPKELHHLLNCEFSDIKPHEFYSVALELEDASILDDNEVPETYTPVYIYVRINRKLPEDGTSIVTQRYEVFIGSETIVVPAFKIYKFIRPTEETCTDVVDAGAMSRPSSSQSKTQIFYSIRRALQEAWKLPKEDRRHVIKRLYLRWHPDKNIGNEKFCKEVFQYIKEIIYKLEQGIPLDDDETDGTNGQRRAYDDYTSSEYFNFFERMNRRGRRDRNRANTFYAPGPSGYRPSHRDSCKQPFKDFAEARRWQTQAEIDLRHARETIDTSGDPPAYNWTCYMCHQASEKSLKAACFAQDANTAEKNSHDISSLASGFPLVHGYAAELANLVGVHTKMRYPDVLHRPHIPSTVYDRDQAMQACELAKQILNVVADNYLN